VHFPFPSKIIDMILPFAGYVVVSKNCHDSPPLFPFSCSSFSCSSSTSSSSSSSSSFSYSSLQHLPIIPTIRLKLFHALPIFFVVAEKEKLYNAAWRRRKRYRNNSQEAVIV